MICLLLMAAACHGQSLLQTPVSLSRQSGATGQFLDDLNRVPGITISYSSAVVDLAKKIRLTGKEKTVEDVLKVICSQQPVNYVEQSGKIFLVATKNKKKFTISGYISDRESGERLIGASIVVPGSNIGTTSNMYGFYSLTLEQDTGRMQVSYAGYHTHTAPMLMSFDHTMDVALEKNAMIHEMVIVKAAARRQTPERTLTGKTDVDAAFIKSVPALLAESDVMKTLQLLPGIQAGTEGSSGLYVRGGSPDQNLVLLDGVPVYNASHAFGLFSIFNSDAVNNVEVLKSGFPSSYGGRLSSVVDVHMKEGDKYEFHGDGGIGLVFSRLTLEGPIEKGRSSFLVSARRTYADLFAIPIQKLTEATSRVYPHFADLNLKANFPTGKQDRVYFSMYMGKDRLRVIDEYNHFTGTQYVDYKDDNLVAWGNTTAMVRWNHVFNKKLFSNFTFTHSKYRFRVRAIEEDKYAASEQHNRTTSAYFSSIRDWGMKVDFDYLPNPAHFIKAGVAGTMHKYWPGVFDINTIHDKEENAIHIEQQTLTSGEYDAYIEDDIRLSSKMKTNIGLRFSAFHVRDKLFTSLQPRINWLYNLSHGFSIKASYGRMNQFIHLLTNSGIGLPTDLWLPVTPNVPPQWSRQVTAGGSWAKDKSFTVSMELYYKTLQHVIDFSEQSLFFNAYDKWDEVVETGRGRAYGMEWMVRKKQGTITGIASYTLSRSIRQFDAINMGQWYPFKYDRRHEVKWSLIWEKSKRFEASVSWFFASGYAVSLPEAAYYDPNTGSMVTVYASRNGYRMPNYHRMDLSVKLLKQKKKHLRCWVFSVYNVYNRFNPFYLEEIESSDPNKRRYYGISIFPFCPSFSYQFKF